MKIKELYQNYLNELSISNNKYLMKILTNETIYRLEKQLSDVSMFIFKNFNNIKFEKTETELPLKFLFIGNKILYNSDELNYDSKEFNNYIQSQIGFILSGRWMLNNKPSNADKNNSLLWIGRFNFDNPKISYNDESLAKLCTRKTNLKIKIWAPTIEEKQIIFNNTINSEIPFIKKENNIFKILSIHLNISEAYIINSFFTYKYNNNKINLLDDSNNTYDYTEINKLIK